MRRRLPVVLAAIMVLAVGSIAAKKKDPSQPAEDPPTTQGTKGVFRPLATEGSFHTMCCTEDGRYLLLADDVADQVKVWDVAGEQVVKTIKCSAPRAMLCRNGRLYVGSFGHGKVLVFDAKTWGSVDELLTGDTDIVSLSAAVGPAFHQQLLATCRHNDRSDNDDSTIVIDAAKDTRQTFEKTGRLSVSADGRYIMSSDVDSHLWKTEDWLSRQRAAEPVSRMTLVHASPYQVSAGNWIFTQRDLYLMNPLRELKAHFADLVVVDRTAPIIYGLSKDQLTASAMTPTVDSLGRVPIRYVDPTLTGSRKTVDVRRLLDSIQRERAGYFAPPIAVTLGETLHVFFIDGAKPVVMCATFDAFKVPPEVASAATQPEKAIAASNAVVTLPVAEAGKPFSYPLPLDAGSNLTLIASPPGMKLAGNVLTWTPPANSAGTSIAIKIRADASGASSFLHYALYVKADGSTLTKAPAPAAPEKPITLPINSDPKMAAFDFVPSADGRKLFVLMADQLVTTDPAGDQVAQTRTLPRQYLRMAERDAYFVAVSANTLDLLDRDKLKVIRSIPLNTSQTYSLAVHPTLRLSYVALHDENFPADASARTWRVLMVDETTGQMRMLSHVYGQWVAVDPLGRALYVGLHDVTQAGYRLDFNYEQFIVPSYQNTDMLATLPLNSGMPMRGKATGDPGVNGRALRVSPDGRSVCYVAAAGRPVLSYAVAAMNPDDFKTQVSYSMKDRGHPQDLAFHPMLPLVAVTSGSDVVVFNRATGDRLKDKLQPVGGREYENADRIFFSADGKHVLITPVVTPDGLRRGGGRPDQTRRVISLPLNLSSEELSVLNRAMPAAPKSVPAPPMDQPGAPAAPAKSRA